MIDLFEKISNILTSIVHGRNYNRTGGLNLSRLSLDDLTIEKRKEWENRISDVLKCPDNENITRHPDAGVITEQDYLVMHNGLKIDPLSYCGYPMLKMLIDNKGVHEPQEEWVFQEVLRYIPKGGTMIELGSYWSFYSMWFNQKVQKANNYMVEPNPTCLDFGKKNFKLNNMNGNFIQAKVGDKFIKDGGSIGSISIDYIVDIEKIDFVNIVHSDIQGEELTMLKGSKQTLEKNKIGYFVISTHSNKIHNACISFLKEYNFNLLASADLDQTYSYDGLIVMSAPFLENMKPVKISLKNEE